MVLVCLQEAGRRGLQELHRPHSQRAVWLVPVLKRPRNCEVHPQCPALPSLAHPPGALRRMPQRRVSQHSENVYHTLKKAFLKGWPALPAACGIAECTVSAWTLYQQQRSMRLLKLLELLQVRS